jgi:HD superfamily phosphohydrolase
MIILGHWKVLCANIPLVQKREEKKMLEIPDQKMFRDVIHGYIRIPRCFVENIIDTSLFQRLRNIDQTGMRVLYPDAKHDRFGHSLGVFHLGCQAVDALLANFRELNKERSGRSDSIDASMAKNKVLFLAACLLHDIGHAPFSHSLENEMHKNSGGKEFDEMLAVELGVGYDELAETNSASHEKIGAFLIVKHLEDHLKKILNYLKDKGCLPHIDATDECVKDDLRFIARMVLGLKFQAEYDPSYFKPEVQIRNCFIELLNGNNFDVDKLDYIIRDTAASGMKNASIDVERLLGAINIVTLTNFNIAKSRVKPVEIEKRTLIQRIDSNSDKSKITLTGYIDATFVLEKGTEFVIGQNNIIRSLKQHGDREARIKSKNV